MILLFLLPPRLELHLAVLRVQIQLSSTTFLNTTFLNHPEFRPDSTPLQLQVRCFRFKASKIRLNSLRPLPPPSLNTPGDPDLSRFSNLRRLLLQSALPSWLSSTAFRVCLRASQITEFIPGSLLSSPPHAPCPSHSQFERLSWAYGW